MNKYVVFLKNPKIWLGIILFIGIIVSIILIIKALKPTPLTHSTVCDLNETEISCPKDNSIKCAPKCPFADMTWNCDSKQCECNDKSAKVCGDQCCTTCNSEKNACCSDNQVYKDSTGTNCCQAGTKPNSTHTGCVVGCGTLTCDKDEECIIVQGLQDPHRQATIDSLKQEGVDVDSQSSTPDILYCAKRGSCGWSSDEKAEPASINNNYFFHNFSKNGLDADGNNGISGCFPDDGSNEDCYLQTNKQDCNGTSGCTWKNLLDELNNDPDENLVNFSKQMANRNKAHNRTTYGDYCQTPDVYGRYVRYTTDSETSPTCTVADCIRQISNNNTVQVAYKEANGKKYCGALRIPDDNGIRVTCNNGIGDTDCETTKDTTTDSTEDGWVFKPCGENAIVNNCPLIGGKQLTCNTPLNNENNTKDTRNCNVKDSYACAEDMQFLDYVAPVIIDKYMWKDPPSSVGAGFKTGQILHKCTDEEEQNKSNNCFEPTVNDKTTCIPGYVPNSNYEELPNSDCIFVCQSDTSRGGVPYYDALDPTKQSDNSHSRADHYVALQIGKYKNDPKDAKRYFCYRKEINMNIPNEDRGNPGDPGSLCCGGSTGDCTSQILAANLAFQGYSRASDCVSSNLEHLKEITDITESIISPDPNNLSIPEFLYKKRTNNDLKKGNPTQQWCRLTHESPKSIFLQQNLADGNTWDPDMGAKYEQGRNENGDYDDMVNVLCPEMLPYVRDF